MKVSRIAQEMARMEDLDELASAASEEHIEPGKRAQNTRGTGDRRFSSRRTWATIAAAVVIVFGITMGALTWAQNESLRIENYNDNASPDSVRIVEHLYAYTVEMPENIRTELERRYSPRTDRIGYLIPICTPKDQEQETRGYIVTIHQDGSRMTWYRYFRVNENTGEIYGLNDFIPLGLDFETVAGYTSLEKPMYLYYKEPHFYAVIGDTAYCLNPVPHDEGLERLDRFPTPEGMQVRDIFQKTPG